MSKLILLKSYPNRIEANLDLELLKNEGVNAVITSDDVGGMQPAAFGAQIMVQSSDFDKAADILKNLNKL